MVQVKLEKWIFAKNNLDLPGAEKTENRSVRNASAKPHSAVRKSLPHSGSYAMRKERPLPADAFRQGSLSTGSAGQAMK